MHDKAIKAMIKAFWELRLRFVIFALAFTVATLAVMVQLEWRWVLEALLGLIGGGLFIAYEVKFFMHYKAEIRGGTNE